MPQTEVKDMQKSGGMKPPGNTYVNRISILYNIYSLRVGASPGNIYVYSPRGRGDFQQVTGI